MTQEAVQEAPPPEPGPLARLLQELLPGVGFAIRETPLDETVTISRDDFSRAMETLKGHERLRFDYLRCLSVVDYSERLEVNYHLFSMKKRHKLVLKTSVSPDEPYVPTVITVWRGADWFEREGHDLFGVVFQGHPNLAPLLLYEGFEGHPGLKSFPFHDYDEW